MATVSAQSGRNYATGRGPELEDRWPSSAIWRDGEPTVRRIGTADIKAALRAGYDDFIALPSHAIFLVILYPIIGLILARLAFGYATMHLVFPAAAGFALLGPLAAIGLYELSRQREMGRSPTAFAALNVVDAKSFNGIVALGLILLGIFVAWMAVAAALYQSVFGAAQPQSASAFIDQVLFTSRGQELIFKGCGIGFIFALLVLAISTFSFPLMVDADRDVSVATAVRTSVRVMAENPATMGLWGLVVAGLLALGSLPLFFGLAFVIPLLGHATWHLYRRAIERG
jgi:uncharacterized membrane protein